MASSTSSLSTFTCANTGINNVTVIDANACEATDSVTLIEPTALTIAILGTNILCNGDATGAADLTVSGGTTGYTFAWEGGATTEDVSGLVADTYTIVVTDANGCTISGNVTLLFGYCSGFKTISKGFVDMPSANTLRLP